MAMAIDEAENVWMSGDQKSKEKVRKTAQIFSAFVAFILAVFCKS